MAPAPDEDEEDDETGAAKREGVQGRPLTKKKGAVVEETSETTRHERNPDESAEHRKQLREYTTTLREAVKQGKNVKSAYEVFASNIIHRCDKSDIGKSIVNANINQVLDMIPDVNGMAWNRFLMGDTALDDSEIGAIQYRLGKPFVLKGPEVPRVWDEDFWRRTALGDQPRQSALKAKCKKMWTHLAEAHNHSAKACTIMAELSDEVESREDYLKIVNAAARPLVSVVTPEFSRLKDRQEQKEEEVRERMRLQLEENNMEEIALEMSVPRKPKPNWEFNTDKTIKANKLLCGMIMMLVQRDMIGEDKVAIRKAKDRYFITTSTFDHMLSGHRFLGGTQARKVKVTGSKNAARGTSRTTKEDTETGERQTGVTSAMVHE